MARFSDLPAELTERIVDMAEMSTILALRLTNKETQCRVFNVFAARCLDDIHIGGSQRSLERAAECFEYIDLTRPKSLSTDESLTFASANRYLGLSGNNKCTVTQAHVEDVPDLLPGLRSLVLRNDTVAMPRAADNWDGGVTINPKDPWLKQREVKTAAFDTHALWALSVAQIPLLADLTLEGVTIKADALCHTLKSMPSLRYLSIRYIDLKYYNFTDALEWIQDYCKKLTRFVIDAVYDGDSLHEYRVLLRSTMALFGGQGYTSSEADEESGELQEIWLWKTRGPMSGVQAVKDGLDIMLTGR